MKDLKNNIDIIIKLADKGSSIVVMEGDDCIQQGYSQLGNS